MQCAERLFLMFIVFKFKNLCVIVDSFLNLHFKKWSIVSNEM